jgi:3-oxoacyl-[acyl-carrier-protein] synthase II
MRRVVVTGVGVVSPFGENAGEFFSALLRGESGISLFQPQTAPHSLFLPAAACREFDAVRSLGAPAANGMDRFSQLGLALFLPAAACREFDAVRSLGAPAANGMDRFSQLGLAAALAAWADAGLGAKSSVPTDAGVAWGTGAGGMLAMEQGYRDLFLNGRERVSPLTVIMAMNNAAASHIAIRLGLGGSCTTSTVACASSAVAIGDALRRIRAGDAELMLVGGSEAPLSYGELRAWQAMRVLAPGDVLSAHRACRPFSVDRSGLVLGEGSGALVLEEAEHARARGARVYAELAGYGASADHHHLVRPSPAGQVRAIAAALADARLTPGDVGYCNAHGTATREGDSCEIAALREVFGRHAGQLAVSATKSMHGHSLGAVSAIEAVVTVLALHRRQIPPTAHLEQIDPACQGVRHITGGASDECPAAAISNAFAFGGSNAVLAFRAVS